MRNYILLALAALAALAATLYFTLTASVFDPTGLALAVALVALLVVLLVLIVLNVLNRPLVFQAVAARLVRRRLATDPAFTLEMAVAELLRRQLRLQAVRLYRERTGVGQKQALEAVDGIARRAAGR